MSSKDSSARVYYAAKIPEIDISALAYFGASIFWRGSIYPWNEDGSTPVRLGPFQEQFRQYLILANLAAFPKDCSLWGTVREGKEVSRLTHPPVGQRQGNFHIYRFPMPGLAFALTVSKNIPVLYREGCFVHAPGNPIIVTTLIEKFLEDAALRMLRQNRRGS